MRHSDVYGVAGNVWSKCYKPLQSRQKAMRDIGPEESNLVLLCIVLNPRHPVGSFKQIFQTGILKVHWIGFY